MLPPTEAQLDGWQAIRRGRDTLIAAPTGSGKTLAAFLTAIDELFREGLETGELPDEVRVIYVSPLKALSADIHKNLAEPRREIRRLAEEIREADGRLHLAQSRHAARLAAEAWRKQVLQSVCEELVSLGQPHVAVVVEEPC